jgi:hypothetical protein
MTKKQTRTGRRRMAQSENVARAGKPIGRVGPRTEGPAASATSQTRTIDINAATKAGASLAIVGVRYLEVHGATMDRAFTELPSEVESDIFFTSPMVETKEDLVSVVTLFTFKLQTGTGPSTSRCGSACINGVALLEETGFRFVRR